MLYFSEIKNKKVVNENGRYVGRVQDLLFVVADNPVITKIVVKTRLRSRSIVALEHVKKINDQITLYNNYQLDTEQENELFVEKNLLDKQIIDIQGNKIVRVNDVVFQNKPFSIAGVDIGILGVFRWFKLEKLLTGFYKLTGASLTSKFLPWSDIQPLELARGTVKLRKEESKLEKFKPEDLANYLERTTISNVSKFLNVIDDKLAGQIFGNLNLNYQLGLIRYLSFEKAAKIISLIDPDEAVDILLTFSQRRREGILPFLDGKKRKEILYLIHLSKTPIGQLVTDEFITVDPEFTADKVIKIIKEKAVDFSFLNYIYVINRDFQLVGVFNLHELLLQNSDTPVYKFMIQNVAVIHLTTPEEIAIKKMIKYKIQAVPVIDENKQILGLVTFDNIANFVLNKL